MRWANKSISTVETLVLDQCWANKPARQNDVLPTTPTITQRWPNDRLLSWISVNQYLTICIAKTINYPWWICLLTYSADVCLSFPFRDGLNSHFRRKGIQSFGGRKHVQYGPWCIFKISNVVKYTWPYIGKISEFFLNFFLTRLHPPLLNPLLTFSPL